MAGFAAQKKLLLLQEAIETDAEWDAVLQQPALSVIDVWPEWAGQCEAMRRQLIRFKLTEGGEDLHLYSANASNITCLSRFRDFSEPTWMFLGSGHLVNLYIGCNCPQILKLVRSELLKERRVMRGELRRKALPMAKLTAVEVARQEALANRERRARQEETERVESELRALRLRAYRRLADALPNYTVVIFLPHALENAKQGGLPEVAEALQAAWRAMGVHVVQSESVAVSAEAADELFWERRLPQHDALVKSFQGGRSVALLLRKGSPPTPASQEDEDVGGHGDAPLRSRSSHEDGVDEPMHLGVLERLIAETVYGFFPGSTSDTPSTRSDSMSGTATTASSSTPSSTSMRDQFRLGNDSWIKASQARMSRGSKSSLERKATADAAGDAEEYDDHDFAEYEGYGGAPFGTQQMWPQELRPVVDSPAAALLKRSSDGDVVLPGMWTPLTPLSKAAAVRVLFSTFALKYYEPEEPTPPPPPTTIICFRARKRNKVLEVASNFIDNIVHMGFFTEDRKLLAETPRQYETLRAKEPRDRLVLAVRHEESFGEPLLELASLGPVYISPNAAMAKADEKEFFSGSSVELAAARPCSSYASFGSEGEGEGEELPMRLMPAAPTPATPPSRTPWLSAGTPTATAPRGPSPPPRPTLFRPAFLPPTRPPLTPPTRTPTRPPTPGPSADRRVDGSTSMLPGSKSPSRRTSSGSAGSPSRPPSRPPPGMGSSGASPRVSAGSLPASRGSAARVGSSTRVLVSHDSTPKPSGTTTAPPGSKRPSPKPSGRVAPVNRPGTARQPLRPSALVGSPRPTPSPGPEGRAVLALVAEESAASSAVEAESGPEEPQGRPTSSRATSTMAIGLETPVRRTLSNPSLPKLPSVKATASVPPIPPGMQEQSASEKSDPILRMSIHSVSSTVPGTPMKAQRTSPESAASSITLKAESYSAKGPPNDTNPTVDKFMREPKNVDSYHGESAKSNLKDSRSQGETDSDESLKSLLKLGGFQNQDDLQL